MTPTYEGVILVPRERSRLAEHLSPVLPMLNWRTHLYLLDGGAELLPASSLFLAEHQLYTMYIHPFLRIDMSGPERAGAEAWEFLAGFTRPFQLEAYDQQGEARLLLLPIIEPAGTTTLQAALAAAEFFSTRLAKPSLYLRGRPAPDQEFLQGTDMRIYTDPDPDSGVNETIRRICVNQIFDDILERIDEGQGELLAPCRRRMIVDERSGEIYACFGHWERGEPFGALDSVVELAGGDEERRDRTACTACISRACASMEADVRANGKLEEGARLALRLAMALSSAGGHAEAEKHARMAFDLASNDGDRAAALLHRGLCNLSLGRLAEAERSLRSGQDYSSDSGLFAYHRGRVQLAWRDHIEAVERFEEALASGSTAVPVNDLLFNAALCHIELEEYGPARRYLDRLAQLTDPSPPLLLYQGVCDLHEKRFDTAMVKFEEALALGPEAEDLSRVLFFIGSCLKELGRFDDAIARLRQAVEADPRDKANHNLLGFCYYSTGRYEEAVSCFERAVEIDPQSAIDYANLGSNLRELGRTEEAVAMYKKALSIDPSIDFARRNLVKLAGD